MALLNILKYPDPVLRQISEKVEVFDDKLAKLASDMSETMIQAHGIGLAAPQVGQLIQLIIVDNSKDDEDHCTRLLTLVNPVIVEAGGKQVFEEGCLSVTNLKAEVKRAMTVKVEAQNIEGKHLELMFDAYRAVVVQHEIDHLNGILFLDHLSTLKRDMYNKRLKRIAKKLDKSDFK
jgi:peptide deformylase